MPTSRNRKLTHKQSEQSKLERYNKSSVKDIAVKIRQIDDIVDVSIKLCGEVIERTKTFVGVDNKYINSLIGGAVKETTELNRRLEDHKRKLNGLVDVKRDVTSSFMRLFSDIVDEMQNIDTGIYRPIFDVQEEINRYADRNNLVDIEEINRYVESLRDLKEGDTNVH